MVYTYHHVLTLISDYASYIDVNNNLPRIKRLIEKAGMDVQPIQEKEARHSTLTVHNGIAQLPCLVIRLLRVTDISDCKIAYSRPQPDQIRPLHIKEGHIIAYYYAYATVTAENGDVDLLLHKGQLDYCAWFVIVQLARDMMVEGKFNPNVYEEYKENMTSAMVQARATSRSMSLDEIEHAIGLFRTGGYRYTHSR